MPVLSKKKTIIYIIIAAVMIAGNVYYFRSNFVGFKKDKINLAADLETQISERALVTPKSSILETELFKQLRKIGDWPVQIPDKVGHPNPFEPYQ